MDVHPFHPLVVQKYCNLEVITTGVDPLFVLINYLGIVSPGITSTDIGVRPSYANWKVLRYLVDGASSHFSRRGSRATSWFIFESS